MPFITVELVEGRTLDQKRELTKRITEVVCETVDVPAERVYVFIEDLKKDSFGNGGKLRMDAEKQS